MKKKPKEKIGPESLLNAWMKSAREIYEEGFGKLLNIPQLGLTRSYQERMFRFVDRFNRFQNETVHFMCLHNMPMMESFKAMQDKLGESAGDEGFPEDFQACYRMWIKILEGSYMTLFKSSQYSRALGKTLDAMEDFTAARQEILQDFLKMLPVPSQKDMDDVYKDLYLLKKRLKQLEKKESAGN